MSLSSYLRDLYRSVYSSLKSEDSIIKIKSSALNDEEKERVINSIKRLIHPSVASIWDAYEVAVMCTSGLIPWVSKEAVEDSKRIVAEVRKSYPYVEKKQEYLSPPSISENPTLQEIATALSWNNKMISRLMMAIQIIENNVRSSLKARCPYCLEDMILMVKENEIIIRCASGTTPACKRSIWRITQQNSGDEQI